MRVAIDGVALGSGRGGDETYMRSLLAGLSEVSDDGDSFRLYLRPDTPVPATVALRANFSVRRLPARRAVVRYAVTWPRALRREAEPADLLHAVVHAPLPSPVRTVLFLPDLSFHRCPQLYPMRTRLRLRWLVPLHLRQASAVITISQFSKRDVVSLYGRSPEDVFVVPIAITPHPDPPSQASRERDGMERRGVREPFILYLGNLHPRKNVARLIRAYVRARNAAPEVARHQLVIAGGRWWGGGEEEREARKAPPESIVFLGRVSDDERRTLLRRATLLAYPSVFEGFGIPPLEAMASATPVLASNAAAIPEVVGDAAYLVDPFNVDALALGLVRLARDPQLRADLRERGRRHVVRYTARATGEGAMEAFRWGMRGARVPAAVAR